MSEYEKVEMGSIKRMPATFELDEILIENNTLKDSSKGLKLVLLLAVTGVVVITIYSYTQKKTNILLVNHINSEDEKVRQRNFKYLGTNTHLTRRSYSKSI